MSLPFWTGKCRVKAKWENDYEKDGNTITYYNLKVADLIDLDNQTFSTTKEVYDAVEEGEDYFFEGKMGTKDNIKWWKINKLATPKDKKA